ncbi:hypothetical protein, partial [Serratia marcescens]|uniref:hypothetical protein n=1 Tax=Serratia marcescens TaxID=615 RepID=UPI00281322FB
DLSRDYVRVHQGDEAAVLARPPPGYDATDWEFICRHHFFTDNFTVRFYLQFKYFPTSLLLNSFLF